MRKIVVAATQMSCTKNKSENIDKAEKLIREAAEKGAQIVLVQELFETPYFCQTEDFEYYKLATELSENLAIKRLAEVAKELEIVIPVSFYEKSGPAYFNSVAVIDADGTILGVYRKTHIPDGPGYEEKFYFSPGDTGFKVWNTKYANIGVGICWDQWFPETARAMALMGAELLFYPTAIGSEPSEPGTDSRRHWQRCMQGHAAANLVPVIASNRIGTELQGESSIEFYGSSFIADETGELAIEADKQSESVLVWEFDLDAVAEKRISWVFFEIEGPNITALLRHSAAK